MWAFRAIRLAGIAPVLTQILPVARIVTALLAVFARDLIRAIEAAQLAPLVALAVPVGPKFPTILAEVAPVIPEVLPILSKVLSVRLNFVLAGA